MIDNDSKEVTNEAAERLRLYAIAFKSERHSFLEAVDKALAAERRATVERITPVLQEIAVAVDESIALFRSRGVVFDKWPVADREFGPWTDEQFAAPLALVGGGAHGRSSRVLNACIPSTTSGTASASS